MCINFERKYQLLCVGCIFSDECVVRSGVTDVSAVSYKIYILIVQLGSCLAFHMGYVMNEIGLGK